MSKFNQFFSKAISNSNNITQVETPRATTNLKAAYDSIANFVNGALSRVQFSSWFYVSGNGLISVSGRKDYENISILPGFYYFDNGAEQNLWESTELYKMAISATQQTLKITSAGKPVLGVLLTLSATNQTNGQCSITSTFDGFIGSREIMISYDAPVTVFIPCRDHFIQQENTFSISGTGTSLDPFILDEDINLTDEQSQSVFKAKTLAATGDNTVSITYQNMYVEVELIPNYFTYLNKFFK